LNLTEREEQIIQLVCEGCPNREIARRLQISISTVKTHLHNVYEKTGIRSRILLIINKK